MRTNIEERACALGNYIPLEKRTTVRDAAAHFGVSKSTVHKDVERWLRSVDPALCASVRELPEINKAERHIRGGLATRRKYKGE